MSTSTGDAEAPAHMLKKRLIAGVLMAAAAGAVLYADHLVAPYYPFLCALCLGAGFLAAREMVALIPEPNRPRRWLCLVGVPALIGVHFAQAAVADVPRYAPESWHPAVDALAAYGPQSWTPFAVGVGLFVLAALLVEMYWYRGDGTSVTKAAHAVFVAGYLGVLPAFFIKLRWLPADASGMMIAAAIFVPKCGDVGAYFVGRRFGKHPMTPRLSPKKTWQGFGGAFLGAVAAAAALHAVGVFALGKELFRCGWIEAVLFGLVVGLAGLLGDLAESLIKRDGQSKDASDSIPGFGGILDVIDSLVFPAPLVYLWFAR